MPLQYQAIRAGFRQARQTPRTRHRDIAQALGVSEGELVAAHCGPFESAESPLKARRLRGEWPAIVAGLDTLGEVTALTHNPSCLHEKVGVYPKTLVNGPDGVRLGLGLGGAIDLHAVYGQWAHGFAVEERLSEGATQRSLQFFDAQGQAVHKVFLRPASSVAAYLRLIEAFGTLHVSAGIGLAAPRVAHAETPDTQIDLKSFQLAWTSMRATHEFAGILDRFGLSRNQALRLAPPEYAHGDTIATFRGEGKPGQAERCDWRKLLASLSPEFETCAR